MEGYRRSFRRYVRLDCQVVRERDFRLIGDLALDLSDRGMLVRSKSRILTGEEVIVSFRPPRRNSTWIDAQATVARVLHGRRPTDKGVCFGLEFEGMDADTKALLFEAIRGLDPAPAARPLRPLVSAA